MRPEQFERLRRPLALLSYFVGVAYGVAYIFEGRYLMAVGMVALLWGFYQYNGRPDWQRFVANKIDKLLRK